MRHDFESVGVADTTISHFSLLIFHYMYLLADFHHGVDDGGAVGEDGLALFAHLEAHHGLAHGGLVRDLAVEGVSLGGAGDGVGEFLTLLILDDHLGAHVHVLAAHLALVQDADVLELGLQFGDACFQGSLVVLGLVVFAVFGQVTEAAGHADLLGGLVTAGGFEVFQFLLELFKALTGHNDFFHIGHSPFGVFGERAYRPL